MAAVRNRHCWWQKDVSSIPSIHPSMSHSSQQAWNSSSRASHAIFWCTKISSEMTFDFRSKVEVDQGKSISALSSLYDSGFGCRVKLSYTSLLITLYVIYVYPESHIV